MSHALDKSGTRDQLGIKTGNLESNSKYGK